MKDFNYYAPTEVVFGIQSEQQIALLVKKYSGHNVLLHYGGQSAERSGLLDEVRRMLMEADIRFVELGGVVPNPLLAKVREGIDLCRREDVDFILAIGGGSVVDSAKAISFGISYNGDVWDFFTGRTIAERVCPIGVVLTIPAAGSEMSNGCVITNTDGYLKRAYNTELCRPKFAVMNPKRTFTLPAWQTSCGIVDMMMHTMERYFSPDGDMTLTDNIAEAVLRTVMECGIELIRNPQDYRNRAQIMWAGSVAHNGLTGCGKTEDWSTHMLEHELSALFDVSHGAGLAAIWGSWARYVYKADVSRFVRFSVNVMGITNDFTNPDHTALKGIEKTEQFFNSLGMPVSIPELVGRQVTEDEIVEMARKCSLNRTSTIGQFRKLEYKDMENIYRMANV